MIGQRDYLDALQAADARAAAAAMSSSLRAGTTPEQWIRDVVAPAQRTVGERWFDGSWSIADEHAATAVAEQAVTLLRPIDDVAHGELQAVFACAEGEWHTFPARLAAELTASSGVHAVLLGASVPADHLARRLAATSPDILALSCTMPTNLLGAWRSINAAHELGIPVVVGGRAWGKDARRATALGADLLLDDPAGLSAVQVKQLAAPVVPPAEALLLEVPEHEVLTLALERHTAASTWMQNMTPFQRRSTLEDLGWLARHAAAAVATDDATIVGELLEWLIAFLTPRGVPTSAVLDSCLYLADAVEPTAPLAASVLRGEQSAARSRIAA